jgi:hypothetical protein
VHGWKLSSREPGDPSGIRFGEFQRHHT